MNLNPEETNSLHNYTHPRLAVLGLLGAGLGLLGALLYFLTEFQAFQAKIIGLRLAALGCILFAFAVSGYASFSVFNRRFD